MDIQPQNAAPRFAPVCQVCKAQNETLRAVTFPFVFSVVVMTYQRAFSGIYCRKHRRQYHLLASVITAIFGWIGIPFGLVWTPMTLLKLARGGLISQHGNFELLVEVADKKLADGDTAGAIRCLEESLRFEDDPEVRRRLTTLYQGHRSLAKLDAPGFLWQAWGVFVVLVLAVVMGVLTGVFDTIITTFLQPVYTSVSSIFLDILSWAPLVLLMFVGALILQSLVGAHLTKNRQPYQTLAIVLAVVAAFTFIYNIIETEFILRNVGQVTQAFAFSSKDGIFYLRSVLTSGAYFSIVNNFGYSNLYGIIHLTLILAGLGIGAYASIYKGLDVTRWQGRLDQVRSVVENREENSALASWGSLAVMSAVPLLAFVLLFPGKAVNVEHAWALVTEGMDLGNRYDYVASMQKLDQAINLWPDSVMTLSDHAVGAMALKDYDRAQADLNKAMQIDPNSLGGNLIMGFFQMGVGESQTAIDHFEVVAASQPAWAMPHAMLAILYYENDRVKESQSELQAAVQYAGNDEQASIYLTGYYLQIHDFQTAEEYALQAVKLGNRPPDYFILARVYSAQEKYDQALKVIAEAERLGARSSDVIEARSNLAQNTGDYKSAEALLLEGLKDEPEEGSLLSELSSVHYDMGLYAQAAKDAEQAIALDPYNGQAYVELAFAYQAQGKTTEAIEAAQTSLKFMPKYDRVHYVLGLCYKDSGMKAEAIREFETFLDLFWERGYMMDEKQLAEQYLQQLK